MIYDFLAPPDGDDWELLSDDVYARVWLRTLPDGRIQTCTVERVDPLIEANERLRNESNGQRFGDGKVVASIPLDKYFRDIVPARKAGDEKWIKKYLNDHDNQKLRTFRGNI